MPDASARSVQPYGGPKVPGADFRDRGDPLSQYFANRPAEQLVAELRTRAKNRYNALVNKGVPRLWRLCYAQAFGMDPNSGRNATQALEFCGPQAQYIRFRIQLTRSLIKQRNEIAAGTRPSFRPVAINNNASTLMQVGIAGKALTYVFREANGEAACYSALESDGYFGEGFVWERWNRQGGDVKTVTEQQPALDPQTQQPIVDPTNGQVVTKPVQVEKRAGAPVYAHLYPWNCWGDPDLVRPPWRECIEKTSKSELMARFPELADRISAMQLKRDDPFMSEMFQWDTQSVTDDVLAVHHFYHESSEAVEGGRYLGYVDDLPLWDEACPLKQGIPIRSMCSFRYFDTSIGYPEASDLLSQQEALDELASQWITNILKFGNQSLWGEDGVEFDPVKFAQGGGYFTLKQGQKPPQVIEWNEVPAGTQYLFEKLPEFMRTGSGVNSTMLGEPENNITSGVFASLMQSIAEKFQSSSQRAFDFMITQVGNDTLELVRTNAQDDFLVQVAGESKIPYMRAFTAGELSGVHSVYVERQSPVFSNIAGRFEVFDKTRQLPKDERGAAIELLRTGDTESWTEFDESFDILVKWENEQLSKGIPCTVSQFDDPKLHAPEHNASLARLRSNPPPQEDQQALALWTAAVNAHVDHINGPNGHGIMWIQTSPITAAMLGLPPPPMPDPMNPMGGFRPQPGTEQPRPGQPGAPPGPPPGASGAQGRPSQPKADPGLPALPDGAPHPAPASRQQPQGGPPQQQNQPQQQPQNGPTV